MTKKTRFQPKKIRNQLTRTFIVTMLIIVSFGVIVFYLSAQTTQMIDRSNGLTHGITNEEAILIESNVKLLARVSFLFLSFGTVLFMYLMFNLMFAITPALRRISFAINEISTGNFEYRLNLPINNEFGDIATTLNSALEKVLESSKALEIEKAGVEKLVERRTKQLNLERGKFLASIYGLPLGFILADSNGRVLMLNPAMELLLKLKRSDDPEIVQKVAAESSLLKKLMAHSHKVSLHKNVTNLDVLTEDGRYLHSLFSPITIDAEEFGGVVILVEDVTEAKIMERSKDEFFSIASHELRTPLTAIRGNASLIKEFYKEQLKDPDLSEMVDDIHTSSLRLIDIVNDFLDASRLEQGKVELKFQTMRVENVIEAVLKEINAVANEKHLYVKSDSASLKELPLVFADPERVEQVLYNLIGNALKFVTEGGVTIKTEVMDRLVKVYIIDTGRGISQENQQLLFHKFQQANSSLLTRDTTRGTGLGLYISKLLTEAMGGHVRLEESATGKGSTFSFTLPIANAKELASFIATPTPTPAVLVATK